ncbi:MAG: ABC transporter ATP-binding protein/permease [Treponema sp.]|nr:ABC transporter ATP-binding protein/permease [Treponema sp.]
MNNEQSDNENLDKPQRISLKEYKLLIPYLSRYKNHYILGLICLIIVDAAQIVIPQFIRIAVDIISSDSFEWKRVIYLCLWMIGTMAFVSAGRFLWRFFINGSARRIEAQLREDIFKHLQKLSWDFYQKNKIGDLMARSINDLHAIRMSIGIGLVALFDFIFMSSAILIIIFIQDAKSAFFSVIPLPLVTIIILFFGGVVGKKFKASYEAYSKMSDNVQETFAGISVVKSFVKEWWFTKKFSDSNDDYRKANMEIVRLFGFLFPFVSLLSGFTILIMLAVGGRLVIQNEMTPGSLVAMFRYLSMLIWPLMGAGFMVTLIQRGAVSLRRINEILSTQPSISDKNEEGKEKREEAVGVHALEIKNLSFAYNGKDKMLEGVSLQIERGQWLGVMGKTGSGKSTFIKTLTRMVDPPLGSVFVFGNDIHDLPLDFLRSLFAVSPQDSYLFSDTIANNIAYGLKDTDNNKVDNAITFASLNKDISIFQNGKDTLIGERGLTLSGGQKQRTAIARAEILKSEFLILDDSFSAVDNETEQKILQSLLQERKGKTTIIVSHRVSTLKYSDKILVLDKGKMLEYGSPSELSASGGFYSKMAAFQRMEEKSYV